MYNDSPTRLKSRVFERSSQCSSPRALEPSTKRFPRDCTCTLMASLADSRLAAPSRCHRPERRIQSGAGVCVPKRKNPKVYRIATGKVPSPPLLLEG